jgi:hypothetical protein
MDYVRETSAWLIKWGALAAAGAIALIVLGWGVEWILGEAVTNPQTGLTRPGFLGGLYEVLTGLAFYVFPIFIPVGVIAALVGWVLSFFVQHPDP